MKSKQLSLLIHPAFLLSLFGLLINDFYLKQFFANELTGKLSDITGLFSFTVFLFAFFSARRNVIILFVTLFFIWWKLPLSDFLIRFCNEKLSLPIGRVIDYTDYWCLVILPLTYYVKPVQYPPSYVKAVAIRCSMVISFFAFTATSMIRKLTDDKKISVDKYVYTKKRKEGIIGSLKEKGIETQKDSAIYEKMWRNDYYIAAKGSDSLATMIPLKNIYPAIYTKTSYGDIYRVPEMYVAGDTIQNVRFIIMPHGRKKTEITIHSFEYNKMNTDSLYYSSYYLYRKFKRPLKKKFKAIVR